MATHFVLNAIGIDYWDPLYLHGLISIPAWINTYIHDNVWDEINYPFPNFNGCTVEIWVWIVILSHTLLGMWLLVHAGI